MHILYVAIHPVHIAQGTLIKQTQPATCACDMVDPFIWSSLQWVHSLLYGVGVSYREELKFPACG